eukprot:3560213-Amphidinium_carterae.1
MIQDYSAVRGQSLSPRAGLVNPYSTPVDRPQALSVDEGDQSNDPMSDIVSMTQELIASIQTSAEGVSTETVSMQRAMVVRRERLNEHIASVLARLMTGVRSTHRT